MDIKAEIKSCEDKANILQSEIAEKVEQEKALRQKAKALKKILDKVEKLL